MTNKNSKGVTSLVLGALLLLSVGLQNAVAQTGSPSDIHQQVQEVLETQGDGWLIEIVDPDAHINDDSIAIDINNVPHISYSDYDDASGQYVLRYANRTGGIWKADKLDYLGGGFVLRSSIDLDEKGMPHIAYNDNNDGNRVAVKYAKWTGVKWVIKTVDSGLYANSHVAMALNSKGYPHITYPHSYVKKANWTGATWNIEGLHWASLPTSIALDNKDYPHISYGRGGLEHAKWTGTSWSIERIVDYNVKYVSFDLDSKHYPHIVFSSSPDYTLRYAAWNGNEWRIEVVESTGKYAAYVAVDRFDRPHLIYKQFDLRPTAIKYATLIDGVWESDVVDWIDRYSNDFSIAVDYCGNPHLSYHDGTTDHLRYATKTVRPCSRNVTLDINPDTINLKSKGKWITAYLKTDDAKAEDIDVSSIMLNDVISPVWWNIENESVLMVKFDRFAVQAILPVSDMVDMKVTGQWKDGENIEVHDSIRIIDPIGSRQVYASFFPGKASSVTFQQERRLLRRI